MNTETPDATGAGGFLFLDLHAASSWSYKVGAMPQPFQCPKTGTYYYRKTIPEPLRPVMGRGREWKVSDLSTSVVRPAITYHIDERAIYK